MPIFCLFDDTYGKGWRQTAITIFLCCPRIFGDDDAHAMACSDDGVLRRWRCKGLTRNSATPWFECCETACIEQLPACRNLVSQSTPQCGESSIVWPQHRWNWQNHVWMHTWFHCGHPVGWNLAVILPLEKIHLRAIWYFHSFILIYIQIVCAVFSSVIPCGHIELDTCIHETTRWDIFIILVVLWADFQLRFHKSRVYWGLLWEYYSK